jgi:glycosyltransferase involved in cell wall biosynthesis
MHIVHLEAGRRLYGGARQAACLIDALAACGVDNTLLCPPGSAIAAAVAHADVVELPLGGDLDPAMGRRIAGVLERLTPSLLHVHSRRGADWFGGRAAARAGLPAVLTRRVESAEPVWWARWKFRPYARIVAISRAIERELVERFGVDPAAIERVPSAVDTALYRPRERCGRLATLFGLPADACVLGCVAQLIARKGHDTLLQSVALLTSAAPQLHLVCFGRGPLAAALERRARELGLGTRVHFAGFRDDLPELLPELDLLVHPAEREGLGVAVLEAMAAGVPVVAARSGGIPDLIDDEHSGVLVAPQDPGALADALARLISDPGLRARLAAQARLRVTEEFSIARMARGNLSVYEEVMRSHGPQR